MSAAACWSSFYDCPPYGAYDLDAIVAAAPPFDVFTVATPQFMAEQWPGLYVGFFDAVGLHGSRGFLVTKRVIDCDQAALRGIACAVSNLETRRGCHGGRAKLLDCGIRWDADIMMSQEK